jgi:hypothetical protein
VAFTYDGSAGANGITLYVDGKLESMTTLSFGGSGPFALGHNTFEIGKRSYVSSPTPFSGSIDDVRIYNRALSAQEVLQLYNAGK